MRAHAGLGSKSVGLGVGWRGSAKVPAPVSRLIDHQQCRAQSSPELTDIRRVDIWMIQSVRGGCRLAPAGEYRGGAEMAVCESNLSGTQPNDRASSVSPRYRLNVQLNGRSYDRGSLRNQGPLSLRGRVNARTRQGFEGVHVLSTAERPGTSHVAESAGGWPHEQAASSSGRVIEGPRNLHDERPEHGAVPRAGLHMPDKAG